MSAPAIPAPSAGTDTPREQLHQLLSESVLHAREQESSAFVAATGDAADTIVLVGAGGLGRRVQRGLRAAGIEPLAFVDNDRRRWGDTIDGTPVLDAATAAGRFPTAAFVVTIWGAGSSHRFVDSAAQLAGVGCRLVRPVAELAWRHPAQLLPHYAMDLPSRLLEQADAVARAFDLLADDGSREEYLAQVRFRLTGDTSVLPRKHPGLQYLLPGIFRPVADEVVLDCGAYDGDSLASWLTDRGPTFVRYVALEPDPKTLVRLREYVAGLDPIVRDRVEVVPVAAAGSAGNITFAANGTGASAVVGGEHIAGATTTTVPTVRLDDLAAELGLPSVTFVKMDIEAAEPDAIEGAEKIVRSGLAVLALSAYHRQDHLWRLPLQVHAMRPDLQLSLRAHNENGWDLVLYAVPPHRLP